MITATIITIGDELLIGQIIDTNSAWIAQEFNKIGIKIKRRIAIADNEAEIIDAVKQAESISDIVIITGGLGPTNDDITKEVLCKYFDTELKTNERILEHIEAFFKKRKREILQVNLDQALLPEKCDVLFNDIGTAPGMMFSENDTLYFSLPGVPFEMKHLVSDRILPILSDKFLLGSLLHKTLITSGMGESFIANKLIDYEAGLHTGIKLAYLPNFGKVRLRLSADDKLKEELDDSFKTLTALLKDITISTEDLSLEQIIYNMLTASGQKIAIAESCTGGNIAAQIVSMSGASTIFQGSTVTYSVESKHNILGIATDILDKNEAVSKEAAKAMAEKVKEKFNADIGLSTTGFLEGQDQYFYAAVSTPDTTTYHKFNLPYDRKLNSKYAVSATFQFLIKVLQNKWQKK